MKPLFITTIAASAGIVFTACDRTDPAPADSSLPKTGEASSKAPDTGSPDPLVPSEAEKKLAARVQELEAGQLAMEQKLEDERLAAADAEIAKEEELLRKDREAWALEQQLAEAKSASPAVPETTGAEPPPVPAETPSAYDYQTFYDDLDPLGSWYDSPDYGYVWQPAVAVSDQAWRPYTRGRWLLADQGWTWASDEPFGWACYHYGRWARVHSRGWVWVPGDQWAPAWVAWRKTDRHIGWCPLPPETVYDRNTTYGAGIDHDCGIYPGAYVFMPVQHFDEPVFSFCEPAPACLSIYSSSINITKCSIRPDRVDCGGPRQEWVSNWVHHPIPRYTLDRESHRPGRPRPARVDSDRIHCYAPNIAAPWNSGLRPARTKASLAGAAIERADSGIPARLGNYFETEKVRRRNEAANLPGPAGRKMMEHQNRLAALEKTREELKQHSREDGNPAPPGETASSNGRDPARPGNRFPGRQNGGDASPPSRESGSPSNPPGAGVAGNPASGRGGEKPNHGQAGEPPVKAPENPRLTAAREELAKLRAAREAVRPSRPDAARPGTPVPENAEPQRRVADAREAELKTRAEQLAKTRADRETADRSGPGSRRPESNSADGPAGNAARERAALAEQRRASEAAANELEKQNAARAALEEKRRRLDEDQNKLTKEEMARQRVALERERRTVEAAARETSRQTAERAALEDKRRQQQDEQAKDTKDQLARQRAAVEEQRRAADAASREASRQNADRAAAGDKRRQEDAANEQAKTRTAQERAAIEQQRRQQQEAANEQAKARIAQERAAIEQQRRQAEAQAQADRQAQAQAAAQQREAMQRQAAEQAARQREAMENQRRQAEEQNRQENQRRQAEERAREQQERRQAEENNRRQQQAEEQNRRQAEENNRRQQQAAEEARRKAEDNAKDADRRKGK